MLIRSTTTVAVCHYVRYGQVYLQILWNFGSAPLLERLMLYVRVDVPMRRIFPLRSPCGVSSTCKQTFPWDHTSRYGGIYLLAREFLACILLQFDGTGQIISHEFDRCSVGLGARWLSFKHFCPSCTHGLFRVIPRLLLAACSCCRVDPCKK